MRLGMKIKRARFSVSDFLYLYAKIMKGERRGKWKTKFSTFVYAEPTPILSKDNER